MLCTALPEIAATFPQRQAGGFYGVIADLKRRNKVGWIKEEASHIVFMSFGQ